MSGSYQLSPDEVLALRMMRDELSVAQQQYIGAVRALVIVHRLEGQWGVAPDGGSLVQSLVQQQAPLALPSMESTRES